MPSAAPFYDLEATASELFLNSVLRALVASGQIPTSFVSEAGFRDGRILASEKHHIHLRIIDPRLYTETGDPQRVGLAASFSGAVTIVATLDEWQIQSPAGTISEPRLEETFEVPFSGMFRAVGQIEIVNGDQARHAIVSFRSLEVLEFEQIGDLEPGRNFTEVVRRILERIAVVELRQSFKLPQLSGLPASLPAPLAALLDIQSGEIGLVDFKVSDAPDENIGDDLHFLFQVRQNLGFQIYDRVHSRTDANSDIALTITARWMREIQLDLWQGGVIPRRFSDQGLPIEDGPNEVVYFGVTALDAGSLRVRVRVKRTVLGFPVTAEVMLEIRPYMEGQYLRLDVLAEQVSFDWAKNVGHTMLFFVLYEVLLRAVLRGVNFLLAPWTERLLADFIARQRIKAVLDFSWTETALHVTLTPVRVPIEAEEFSLLARLDITSLGSK